MAFSTVTMSTTVAVFELSTLNVTVGIDNQTATSAYNGYLNPVTSGDRNSMRATTQILLIIIGLIGITVNGLVLIVLFAFKQLRKNTTNVFIGNQTFVDAVACIALAVTTIIQKTGASNYAVGFSRRILCLFFDNTSFLGASVYASKYGLVVITLERYFKVVHPVKYRNLLRPWMVKLGVIMPWMDGLLLVILPMTLASEVVNGKCTVAIAKPEAGKLYCTIMFVWHYLLPLLIFIFCYSKILSVVRRQSRIAADKNQRRSAACDPPDNRRPTKARSDALTTEQFPPGEVDNGTRVDEDRGDQHLSQTEKKVIRTMLTVTACFIICWSPSDFFQVIPWFVPQLPVSFAGQQVMTVLAYLNILLNAVIYSSHLSVVRRSWRAFCQLCIAGNPNELAMTYTSRVTSST
jgi:hypothetical protein